MEAKKLKIQQYVYEKILKDDVEISIPQEPVYLREENSRCLTGIFPQRQDWDGGDGDVWELQIIEITETRI